MPTDPTDTTAPAEAAPPSSATAAVLVASEPVPEGARQVRGVDFDRYQGRDITVAELVSHMAGMGFQATAVADAVRIINDMRAYRDPETGDGTTIFLGYTTATCRPSSRRRAASRRT
ncbi:hypothetical protein VTN02DRAFT_1094 [Thermoascus thermophilus]